MGLGTTLFWLFLLRLTLLSVLMAWVYNNNRRSKLSAILFRFAYNFTFSLVYPVPETTHLSGTILILLLVSAVVVILGSGTLTRREVLSVE
jgi:hypothetical protein